MPARSSSRVRKLAGWVVSAMGVALVLTVLASRSAPRTTADAWKTRRDVAIVLVEPPSDRAPAVLVDAFRTRLQALRERLDFQVGDRLSPPTSGSRCWGKVVFRLEPMTLPGAAGAEADLPVVAGVDRPSASRTLARWANALDARTPFDGAFTRRIYVVMRGRDRRDEARAARGVVVAHGGSEVGGVAGIVGGRPSYGAVDVELIDDEAIGRALFAVAHELMHTLGAEDRRGHADGDFEGAHGWLDVMGVRADGELAGGTEAKLRIDDRAARAIGVP